MQCEQYSPKAVMIEKANTDYFVIVSPNSVMECIHFCEIFINKLGPGMLNDLGNDIRKNYVNIMF